MATAPGVSSEAARRGSTRPASKEATTAAASSELHLVDDDGTLIGENPLGRHLASIIAPGGGAAMVDPSDAARPLGEAQLKVLRQVGVRYHVVGIFGGQSSGKSTLLNHLFGTSFQMMNESVRRGQTTKGAFLALANNMSATSVESSSSHVDPTTVSTSAHRSTSLAGPLFVVDFEGTDGMERGEDQSFERQLSLFALSVADILIINMWAVDVGRFNAANMSLLRTIFDVNLQLFSHERYTREEKPTLLVVLRDFTEDDPSHHIATVRKSFDSIWEAIHKPEGFEGSSIDSLFVLKYFFLPHFKLQRAEFDASVRRLRDWFVNPQRSDTYLFQSVDMFRGVPLEGLPSYLTSCWSAIKKNKDLDIPTQRDMLANHRCKDVMESVLEKFRLLCNLFDERLARGEMILQLSSTLEAEIGRCHKEFHDGTRLYTAAIAKSFGAQLERELMTATLSLLRRYSKKIATDVLAQLEGPLQLSVDQAVKGVPKGVQTQRGEGGSWTSRVTGVDDSAAAASMQVDSELCNELVRQFWATARELAASAVERLSTDPPDTGIYSQYAVLVSQDRAVRECVVQLATDAAFNKIRSRLTSMAENASDTMHRVFEYALTHNADGTKNFVSTTAGLRKTYPVAQSAGLAMLGCLFYFRLALATPNEGDGVEDTPADGEGEINATGCVRRWLRRSRRVIRLRESADERAFLMRFCSLDEYPEYPSLPHLTRPPTTVTRGKDGGDVNAANGEACEDPTAPEGFDGDNVLITKAGALRAFDLYNQRCDFTLQMQLRSIESGKNNLPGWVYVALLVLGWNELWYVLSSPLLLCILVLVTFVFFKNFLAAQWSAFEETGPPGVVLALKTVVQPLVRGLMETLAVVSPQGDTSNEPAEKKRDGDPPPVVIAKRRPIADEVAASSNAMGHSEGLRQRRSKPQ